MRAIRILVLAAALLSAGAAGAEEAAAKQVTVNIEQQPLRDALSQFASQTGFQVLRRDEDVALDGLIAPRVVGTYAPDVAIGRLLANSRLSYEFVNARTVRISSASARPERKTGIAVTDVFKLAQVGTVADGRSAARQGVDNTAAGEDRATKGIPEMLVKGRRSANTDIQRTEDDVQPYVVFTAEEISQSMTGNLSEFLAARLTMNTAPVGTTSPQFVSSGFNGNISEINLRGLGSNQTLILVNGRRLPGLRTGGDFAQADINGIPLSAIQRIEVLPSTAGGIYGGGATGGVINIILKNNFTGMELTAIYDNTFASDVGRRRIEGNGGFTLEGGRTSVMLSGSYSETAMLAAGERDFLARARDLMLQNNRAAFYGGTSPPSGATANIRSATTQNLTLKQGNRSLGSLIAHVPVGYAGPASDGGLAFLQTADSYNLGIPQGRGGVERSMNSSPETWSASLRMSRDFTDRIEGFLNASLTRNDSMTRNNRFPTTVITLPSTAPNNPFVQNIRVQFPASDFISGTDLTIQTKSLNSSAGFIARLPRRWTLQADYGWSRSTRAYQYNTAVIRTSGNTALANGTLNIMRDVDAHPLDYSAYLMPAPNYFLGPYDLDLTSVNARVAGPTVSLPGGPVNLAAVLETRNSQLKPYLNTLYSPSTGLPGYIYGAPRHQSADSAYAEATAPLISAKNALRFVRALDMEASYRYERTTTKGVADVMYDVTSVSSPDGPFPEPEYTTSDVSASQYKLGLRYQPMAALALRASFSASVLTPSLSQLVPFEFGSLSVSALDPKRKNEPVGQVESYSSSGNTNLQPEQARSWSFGAILTPDALPGLRVSVDYTRIRKRDEIAMITAQQVLDLEFQGVLPAGYITREPLSAQDQADGYLAGRIITFADGQVNAARAEVDAYDLQIDYPWRTSYGVLRASAMASWQPHLKRLVMNGTGINDLVGFSDGPLEWRGNAGLTWERKAWTAGWNMQYFHSYLVYSSTSNQATIDTTVLGQGSDTVPHEIYHDAFVRYEFDRAGMPAQGWLANTKVMVGIRNVFDRAPAILATTSLTFGGYNRYGDPLGRRYSISLTKSFE